MKFNVYFLEDSLREYKKLPKNIRERIDNAIENRLKVAPDKYGEPLKYGLEGYWKIRIGDYRLVFRFYQKKLIIVKIAHRKEIYKRM